MGTIREAPHTNTSGPCPITGVTLAHSMLSYRGVPYLKRDFGACWSDNHNVEEDVV
jgi:hypothetical protein